MSALKLLRKLAGFKGLTITGFCFSGGRLHLQVKLSRCGCRCQQCGRRGTIITSSTHDSRQWEDIRLGAWVLILHYMPREIHCLTHGRGQEQIPWAHPKSRVTYRHDYQLLRLSQQMTQSQVAKLLGVPPSTLSGRLHRAIERYRDGHEIENLHYIGIDEVSYCKGHKYLTIVYDLERSVVVWIGIGKARKTIDHFFGEVLEEWQLDEIKGACCDMSDTFIGAIEDFCPNAVLVLDRFHVMKALNEALDEVRKEQWRNAPKEGRKALKGLRWLLFKHAGNRTKKDTRDLNTLQKSNRRIYRAWVLKDEFNRFWEYTYEASAASFLKNWTKSALLSRLEPIRKFVRTLRGHQHRIITFIKCPLTNAIAEGLNRMIRQIRNRASGFRNVECFKDLIYLTVGDLDIAGEIPEDQQLVWL
ncbi:MAG: ISL3 family transposase ISMac21 [Pseudohongiella sp.]|nr:MAG: ISL3 family transposase ISMac21 [marine bacterium B5-7]GJM14437.1 MAG: ISL3 family transposase ISMac21 [Pseudohongiella sp.]